MFENLHRVGVQVILYSHHSTQRWTFLMLTPFSCCRMIQQRRTCLSLLITWSQWNTCGSLISCSARMRSAFSSTWKWVRNRTWIARYWVMLQKGIGLFSVGWFFQNELVDIVCAVLMRQYAYMDKDGSFKMWRRNTQSCVWWGRRCFRCNNWHKWNKCCVTYT